MGILYDAWATLWLKLSPQSQLSTTIWPPENVYDPARDMPQQTGKVVLITGGNSGIGYDCALHLLREGAKVYVAGRSTTRLREAIERLEADTGRIAFALELDLADLGSVRKAALDLLEKESQLDILFCNAGAFWSPVDAFTNQNYDEQFGTNVIGHYLLARLLLPALKASSATGGTKSRMVHTSSASHQDAPQTGIIFDTLCSGPERDAIIKKWPAPVAPLILYAQSKLGNNLVANLFDRLHGTDIVSSSVHPGMVHTPLHGYAPWWQKMMMSWFSWPGHMGALTLVWAATADEAEGFGGKYLIPWARMGKADGRADDVELQDKLKAWLDEQVKGYV